MEHNGYYTSDPNHKHGDEDKGGNLFAAFSLCFVCLCQEIVAIVFRSKIIRSTGFPTERLAITNLLDVAKATGNASIAVRIERIKVDTDPRVHTGVNFRSIQNGT